MLAGGAAFGLYLDSVLFEKAHAGIGFHSLCFIIGFLLIVLLIRISKNTGRTLAKYGREGDLKRMETNVLVTRGVYKYMRHPMYLGLFLLPVSFAFLIGSPSFILIIAPGEIIFMLIMIRFIEEPGAIKKFGKDYVEYKNHLPWFCFKMHCLKELLKKFENDSDPRDIEA